MAETKSFTVQVDPTGVTTVRVRLTDADYLQLAEVEVLEQETESNLAPAGTATQSSSFNANTDPEKAIDGDTISAYPTSVSITQNEPGAWWEVDLGGGFDVGTITVYNRPAAGTHLEGAVVEALDFGGSAVWSDTITGATNGSIHTFVVSPIRALNVGIADRSISENGVPATVAATSQTFARFRFNSTEGLSFDGPASDGEGEDYAMAIDANLVTVIDDGDAGFSTTRGGLRRGSSLQSGGCRQ